MAENRSFDFRLRMNFYYKYLKLWIRNGFFHYHLRPCTDSAVYVVLWLVEKLCRSVEQGISRIPRCRRSEFYSDVVRRCNGRKLNDLGFSFIYVWHGIMPNVLKWSVLNYIGIVTETAGRTLWKNEMYQKMEKSLLGPR